MDTAAIFEHSTDRSMFIEDSHVWSSITSPESSTPAHGTVTISHHYRSGTKIIEKLFTYRIRTRMPSSTSTWSATRLTTINCISHQYTFRNHCSCFALMIFTEERD